MTPSPTSASAVDPPVITPREETPARSARWLAPVATVLRYVGYPVLLMAAAATAIVSIWLAGGKLPLVSFCFVLFAFGYLALLERIIPYNKGRFRVLGGSPTRPRSGCVSRTNPDVTGPLATQYWCCRIGRARRTSRLLSTSAHSKIRTSGRGCGPCGAAPSLRACGQPRGRRQLAVHRLSMGSRARPHKSTALPDARKSPTDSVGSPTARTLRAP
jgi:hypothetical protein